MLKARQKLGKYRILGRLDEGGFATVYRAYDSIEGITVALKIPHKRLLSDDLLDTFRKEVRLTATLDHPNILPIKNASFIGRHFVIVHPLGDGTLEQRLCRRIAVGTAIDFTEQMLSAVAFAHRQRIIHCDIKPDNFILFPGPRLRLADFGIAKVALRTRTPSAKGTGTLGYVAPEQALGKPSLRSDVFSLGLVLWRLFSGHLPEWPYEWPLPGFDRVRYKLHGDFIAFLQRALKIDERKRYEDAIHMQSAFRRIKGRALRRTTQSRRKKKARTQPRWQTVREREFLRRYGKALEIGSACTRCGGPLAETMLCCPWCGDRKRIYRGPTSFPARCKRCGRGVKLDWRFCAWCYGEAIGPRSPRTYRDSRYTAQCHNNSCGRKDQMPFTRYCPWCRRKTTRKWKITGSQDKCVRCGWGVLGEFWSYCPWCGRTIVGK